MRNSKKTIARYFLLIVFLATVITAGIDLYSYEDVNYGTLYIQRQFGNEIKFNILFIIILIGVIFSMNLKKKARENSVIKWLLIVSIISLIFPNGKDFHLSIIGLVSIVKYYLLYFSLVHIYTFDRYKQCFRKTLIFVLLIESVGGFLQVFFNITIPFFTSRNVASYRGNALRMAGTMLFSADFALIITFITVFLLCDYLFNNNRKVLKYLLLCVIDLWYSGSRTMIIAATAIFAYDLMKKYKNKPQYKLLIALFCSMGILLFINTEKFFEYFVADSIIKMLSTRLVHWRMGFKIFSQHPFMGVGLNNSVLYANRNYEIVQQSYKLSLEPISFYFTNPIHNSVFIMFTELGLIGGVLYLAIFLEPVFKCVKWKIYGEKADLYFIVSESLILLIYAFQGWGSLREHGMVLMVVLYAYYKLLDSKSKMQKRKLCNK